MDADDPIRELLDHVRAAINDLLGINRTLVTHDTVDLLYSADQHINNAIDALLNHD